MLSTFNIIYLHTFQPQPGVPQPGVVRPGVVRPRFNIQPQPDVPQLGVVRPRFYSAAAQQSRPILAAAANRYANHEHGWVIAQRNPGNERHAANCKSDTLFYYEY